MVGETSLTPASFPVPAGLISFSVVAATPAEELVAPACSAAACARTICGLSARTNIRPLMRIHCIKAPPKFLAQVRAPLLLDLFYCRAESSALTRSDSKRTAKTRQTPRRESPRYRRAESSARTRRTLQVFIAG